MRSRDEALPSRLLEECGHTFIEIFQCILPHCKATGIKFKRPGKKTSADTTECQKQPSPEQRCEVSATAFQNNMDLSPLELYVIPSLTCFISHRGLCAVSCLNTVRWENTARYWTQSGNKHVFSLLCRFTCYTNKFSMWKSLYFYLTHSVSNF